MAQTVQSNVDTLVGRVVVEQGLATREEVSACESMLRSAAEEGGDPSALSLAALLVEQGIVTQRQVNRIRPKVDEQRVTQQIPGFQILKKLGAGAMATVYLARQISLDRKVAVKVLPKKYTNNKEFVERFYAEGRAAARLNHPNIVAAYDVGHAGEYHYFVMEYVDGKTVYDDIAAGTPYEEGHALGIIVQIAQALVHAHKAGFIHRDLKPKNIMFTNDGTAKLADMGLARAVSDREAAEAEQGKAYGTPYYISPEQIRGDVNVDFRCDIYGLGATFYHMVTGQVPFDGPNPSAVMHRHLKARLEPPDHVNPKLSTGVGEIIEVCMAKNRDERYATTADLLDDLESVARGEAPAQARRRFDISSLSALEASGEGVEPVEVPAMMRRGGAPLAAKPLFWAALLGWAMATVLTILHLLR